MKVAATVRTVDPPGLLHRFHGVRNATVSTEGPELSILEAVANRRGWGDEGWEERAACRGADVEVFFSVEEEDQKAALEFCTRCEVRGECLESAVANREMYGIWGGMLESDRRSLIRDIRRREREKRRARRDDENAA